MTMVPALLPPACRKPSPDRHVLALEEVRGDLLTLALRHAEGLPLPLRLTEALAEAETIARPKSETLS